MTYQAFNSHAKPPPTIQSCFPFHTQHNKIPFNLMLYKCIPMSNPTKSWLITWQHIMQTIWDFRNKTAACVKLQKFCIYIKIKDNW